MVSRLFEEKISKFKYSVCRLLIFLLNINSRWMWQSVTKRPASVGSNVAWENEDRSNSRQEIVDHEETKGKDDCCSGFQRALRGHWPKLVCKNCLKDYSSISMFKYLPVITTAVWVTRLTVDTDNNRDLFIKTTLRELVIYCLFLAVICISK